MIVLQWIRFSFAALFLVCGLIIFFAALVGLFRFKNTLNRIHVAAKCDTFGLLLILSSLIIMYGFSLESLKLLVIITFFWLSIPVASHLVAHMEITTNPDIKEEFEVIGEPNDNN